MQTSKFECVIAGWIFSSRQGRTAPSKKELVTIERGDINQRVPFFMPLSLEWGHFLLASFLPSIPAKYNFLYCYTTANNLGIMQIAALSWILKQAYNWKWKDKRDPLLQQQCVRRTFHNHQSVNCKRAGGKNSRLFIIMMTSKKLLCYSDFISAFILS